MRHAVILAGGSGTRLWPLSRRDRPKQFLRLFGGHSLLRHAFDRIAALFDPAAIRVVAGEAHEPLVREELPELPASSFVGEPHARNTAAAIGLVAHIVRALDDEATMAVFTADHLIEPVERFQATVTRALTAAESEPAALVTIGVLPQAAHAGYGYVHRGAEVSPGVYNVAGFHEKPDLETARRYVASGEYAWNSGMFAWRVDAILDELSRCVPATDAALRGIAGSAGRFDAEARRTYAQLPSISIDHAVLEKASQVRMVALDCDWLDVGSWDAVSQTAEADDCGNAQIGGAGARIDANGNLVIASAEHLVALIGVRDLVVVQTGDVTLVCRRDDSQRLRELVEHIQTRHGGKYL